LIFQQALSFAVVVLIASIPLAVEIVTTTTLAMGSRSLSKHGAIVTRLAAIEEMAGMDMLCSDKTGTLTLNKMVIQVPVDRCIYALTFTTGHCVVVAGRLSDLQRRREQGDHHVPGAGKD
jgi:P-type E1-E2 ATPase